VRYRPEHKEKTRERIVEAAASRFRRGGAEGASPPLPEIMEAAGLTVGGFYRHFESKDELFLAALDHALAETLEVVRSIEQEDTGLAWMAKAAATYLHPSHRDNVAQGCPLPALTAEVARRGESARVRFQEPLRQIVDEIAEHLPDDGTLDRRDRAWGFLATLVGGLLLARGVADSKEADEILRACRMVATGC